MRRIYRNDLKTYKLVLRLLFHLLSQKDKKMNYKMNKEFEKDLNDFDKNLDSLIKLVEEIENELFK